MEWIERIEEKKKNIKIEHREFYLNNLFTYSPAKAYGLETTRGGGGGGGGQGG